MKELITFAAILILSIIIFLFKIISIKKKNKQNSFFIPINIKESYNKICVPNSVINIKKRNYYGDAPQDNLDDLYISPVQTLDSFSNRNIKKIEKEISILFCTVSIKGKEVLLKSYPFYHTADFLKFKIKQRKMINIFYNLNSEWAFFELDE